MFTETIQAGILPCFLVLFGLWVFQIIYHFYFHPLSKIPGPWLAAISDIPYCWWLIGGRQPFKMLELHNKYGPTVRVGPNEVSFNTAQAWKDIHTHGSGRQTFQKGKFYDGACFATEEFNRGLSTIVSERRPEVHKQMKSHWASAFSERAIVEQEELICTSVDKFIRQVGIRGSKKEGFDIGLMFEAMTFDVMGDLAFGKAFGALDEETRHPWIAAAIGSLMMAVLVDVLNHYPTLARGVVVLLNGKFKKALKDMRTNERFVHDTVKRRIETKTDRKDLLTRIIQERDPNVVSDRQIAAHSSDIVIAGSDTTATALSAIVYFLLHNPSSLAKLMAEVRDTFKQYSQITYSSTVKMKYLHAVIQEGLRVFPPVSFPLPRDVPDGGATVDGQFLPGGVHVAANPIAACLSSTNFHDPWSWKPERWIDSDNSDVFDSSQPFSLGPRVCIGRNVAWLELHVTLAKLFWVYDLEPVDPTLDWHKEVRMISLWKMPKLMVRAKNRGVDIY
ncbi:benzoate 4-monooxygenase cytochrome P450 [Annulohypoxylon truncatum]|uniref:benzoate 4-monooxygenase cytochrome P450 n=1 Tax=Annulohypoxylon truncatum TaxID=327061 RepID=UPI002007B66B|nr:benzoate 4-monooxygenase cytochrome P450 [Annulohypoxylon truncatum]KAI1209970.1 benzoate 4-monooxygenase cytochrome P450 [Annulohypoxylon truncatum]